MFFSYGLLWFAILELYYSAGSTGNPWILLQYTIRLAGFEIYYSVTEILFLDLPGIFGFVLGPTGNPIHVCNSRKVKLTWASE